MALYNHYTTEINKLQQEQSAAKIKLVGKTEGEKKELREETEKSKIRSTSQAVDLQTIAPGLYFFRLQNSRSIKVVRE